LTPAGRHGGAAQAERPRLRRRSAGVGKTRLSKKASTQASQRCPHCRHTAVWAVCAVCTGDAGWPPRRRSAGRSPSLGLVSGGRRKGRTFRLSGAAWGRLGLPGPASAEERWCSFHTSLVLVSHVVGTHFILRWYSVHTSLVLISYLLENGYPARK